MTRGARLVLLVCLAGLLFGAPASTSLAQPAGKNGTYTNRATGMTLTIKRIVVDTRATGLMLPKGDDYVMLQVTVHNGGKVARQFSPFNVWLVAPRANCSETCAYNTALPPSDASTYTPAIQLGSVAAGRTIGGWIPYNVPKGHRTVEVLWNDGPSSRLVVGRYRI